MNREEAIQRIKDIRWEHATNKTNPDHVALSMAISALSAEGEYIKKEDALAELDKWEWQELYLPIHFKENILDVLPTYSFPDREKGEDRFKSHWITYRNSDRCECANCGHQIHFEYPYCPNCGADMRGDKAE